MEEQLIIVKTPTVLTETVVVSEPPITVQIEGSDLSVIVKAPSTIIQVEKEIETITVNQVEDPVVKILEISQGAKGSTGPQGPAGIPGANIMTGFGPP